LLLSAKHLFLALLSCGELFLREAPVARRLSAHGRAELEQRRDQLELELRLVTFGKPGCAFELHPCCSNRRAWRERTPLADYLRSGCDLRASGAPRVLADGSGVMTATLRSDEAPRLRAAGWPRGCAASAAWALARLGCVKATPELPLSLPQWQLSPAPAGLFLWPGCNQSSAAPLQQRWGGLLITLAE
jgi:hypothetical protein